MQLTKVTLYQHQQDDIRNRFEQDQQEHTGNYKNRTMTRMKGPRTLVLSNSYASKGTPLVQNNNKQLSQFQSPDRWYINNVYRAGSEQSPVKWREHGIITHSGLALCVCLCVSACSYLPYRIRM